MFGQFERDVKEDPTQGLLVRIGRSDARRTIFEQKKLVLKGISRHVHQKFILNKDADQELVWAWACLISSIYYNSGMKVTASIDDPISWIKAVVKDRPISSNSD